MPGIIKINESEISKQNISYYNEIAPDYDSILENDAANKTIREKVADRFAELVKKGSVLDFGGGTGKDLYWMKQQHYQVIFCEPSAAMRHIAIERSRKNLDGINISFLDGGETDFRNWPGKWPFEQKVDAVIANFAVVNCIPDIDLLFKNLALITKPGSIVLALILDNSLRKRLRSNLKGTLLSFLSDQPITYSIEYHERQQSVYLHSNKAIKKAVSENFTFESSMPIAAGFSLIHLTRK